VVPGPVTKTEDVDGENEPEGIQPADPEIE
jgi:hypothetical protein